MFLLKCPPLLLLVPLLSFVVVGGGGGVAATDDPIVDDILGNVVAAHKLDSDPRSKSILEHLAHR